MEMEKKPEAIKKRLRKKGFVFRPDYIDGHDAYVICNPETGNEIFTYFSRGGHGKDTLDQWTLHKMAHELKFDSYADFQRFISCTMSEEEYRGCMKAKGLLNRKHRAGRWLGRY